MIARGRGSGFTLVELIVVLAVIGLLVALLAPALLSVQGSVRRLGCENHLRQIGLAMTSYANTWDTFPPGGVEWRPARQPSKRQLAWSAFILPYLEEGPLYDQLNLDTPFDSAANTTAAGEILEVYLCPAVPTRPLRIDGRGACHYGGIYGERITGPNSPPKGVLIYDRVFTREEIRDGIAHTVLVSEDSQFKDGQWINGLNLFDQAFAINKAPSFENDMRSEHPGGVNALLADGSVRFLDENMDLQRLAALCTRDQGDDPGHD